MKHLTFDHRYGRRMETDGLIEEIEELVGMLDILHDGDNELLQVITDALERYKFFMGVVVMKTKPATISRTWNHGWEYEITVGGKVVYCSCYEGAAREVMAKLNRKKHNELFYKSL